MNKVYPRLRLRALILAGICFFLITTGATRTKTQTNPVPSPESVLGFKPGSDRKLANWSQFVEYFRRLDEASDRVSVTQLGQTTLKRPFIAATISSAENLKRLDEFREIQRKLADPRLLASSGDEVVEDLIGRGRTVVVITCSIHSTEVGGTFTATDLAYRLASGDSPEIRQILDNVIILLVPSLNPDGTDIVADWYRKTLGTAAEGTAPPELYHHYTGHDNNRDWYAFTQVETQLTVEKLLNGWHPQILHDIHQMGGSGARFFVPPYIDPWEPNIDPSIVAGVNALGSSIAWEMTGQGRSGVVFNGIFDAWTPARAYAHYHGGLRILSETASARLATPVEIPFERLGAGPNYDAKVATWNFPRPWRGGKWTLGDIVDYQRSGALALLSHAARHRGLYLRNFLEIGRRAIAGENMPFAFILPEPVVPKSLADAFKRLNSGLGNVTGTPAERHEKGEALVKAISNEPSSAEEVSYYYKIEGLDRLLTILKRGGVEVSRANQEFEAGGHKYPAGTHVILMRQPYGSFAKTLLEPQRYPDLREYPGGPPRRPYDVTTHSLSLLMNVRAIAVKDPFVVDSRPEPGALVIQSRVRSIAGVRLALYKNYLASMDEGWTRWIFDQYKIPFTSLHDAEIRAGELSTRYDVIIIPDQSTTALVNGLPGSAATGESGAAYPAEYAGGLGDQGIRALREFVAAGGTIITLNHASNFAIEKLGVPVRNVLDRVSVREFYCPGSILQTSLDTGNPLTFGLEKEMIAWFENSPAFEVIDNNSVRVVAGYPAQGSTLLSGWILGEHLIRGKAALVEARIGKGRVILFGFRPQYRAQSLATMPLLFNAILTSKNE